MQHRGGRLRPAVPGAPARVGSEALAEPAREVDSPGPVPETLLALQSLIGNRSVTQAVSRRGRSLSRQADLGSPGDEFNPISRAHDLIRAIDQSDTHPYSREKYEFLKPSGDDIMRIGETELVVLRKIDVGAVVKALDGLTHSQVTEIDKRYALEENGRSLAEDLFRLGESGHKSNLDQDERTRIGALLQGTKAEKGGPAVGPVATGPTDARITADAVELHQLLGDDLDEAAQERVMALHRRAVGEISRLDAEYERLYHLALGVQLGERLKGLQRNRMAELRDGNLALADACAIDDKRRKIDELEEKYKELDVPGSFGDVVRAEKEKKRNELIGGIDAIVETNRLEAMAEAGATGKSTEAAVQQRLHAVLATKDGDDGGTLGGALAKTLGPAEGGAIAAMARGSSAPDVAAQRLLEMEAMHTTKTEKIADLMKGLRSQAAQDLVSRASDPWGSDAEKQEMLKNPQAAADKLAREYTAGFKTSYDNARGEMRSFDEIVSSAADYNADMLRQLQAAGGTLTTVQELDHAIRAKDADAIKKVLGGLKTAKQVRELEADYQGLGRGNLRETLFGALGPEAAEELDKYVSGAMLSGRDAALVEEALQKPERLGGVEEVDWLASYGHRELEVTEDHKGAIGHIRSWGGDPETEVLMKHSAQRLVELQTEWNGDPWAGGRPRQRILAEMRHWRATLTGDASAYEAENEAIIAEIRSAVSLAVQIALAVTLPGVAEGFLAAMALNIGATVATNVVIYGDEYSLTHLRNDILGGVAGGIGGKAAEEIAGGVAEQLLGRVAGPAAEAAEKAGISTAIAGAKEAEQIAAAGVWTDRAVKAIRFTANTGGATVASVGATGGELSAADFGKAFLLGLAGKAAEPERAGTGSKPGGSEEARSGEEPAAPAPAAPRTGEAAPLETGPAASPETGPAEPRMPAGEAPADPEGAGGPAKPERAARASERLEARALVNSTEQLASRWPGLDRQGRLVELTAAGNQALAARGIPNVEFVTGEVEGGGDGKFDYQKWKVVLKEELVNQPSLAPKAVEVMSELSRHEVEHTMQWWAMARLRASQGATPATIEAEMSVPPEIAQHAVDVTAHSGPLSQSEAAAAQVLFDTVYGGSRPVRDFNLDQRKTYFERRAQLDAQIKQARDSGQPVDPALVKQREAVQQVLEGFESMYMTSPEERGAYESGGIVGAEAPLLEAERQADLADIAFEQVEDLAREIEDELLEYIAAGLEAPADLAADHSNVLDRLEALEDRAFEVGAERDAVAQQVASRGQGGEATAAVAPAVRPGLGAGGAAGRAPALPGGKGGGRRSRQGGFDDEDGASAGGGKEGKGGRGPEKTDLEQVDAVARKLGMTEEERNAFGRHIEEEKAKGEGGSQNDRGDYSYRELLALGRSFLEEHRNPEAAGPAQEDESTSPAGAGPHDEPALLGPEPRPFTREEAFGELLRRRPELRGRPAEDFTVESFEDENSNVEGQIRKVLAIRIMKGDRRGELLRYSIAWATETGTYEDIHEASR